MAAEFLTQWPMWVSLLAVLVTILLYMFDRWSMEIVSAGVIAALLLIFSLPGAVGTDGEPITSANLLAGFGNPALITIMALLIVGQGLFQTGALEGPTKALLSSYGKRPVSTLLMTFLSVFAISAFTNNTPVVIMFLPIMSSIAMRMKTSPSLLMMPLSFVSILAGMTTLIGTSTNLLAADALRRIDGIRLDFFEQTSMGLVLAAIGMVYILVMARFLLPDRGTFAEEIVPSGKQFVAQIEVTPNHFLLGKRPVAGMFPDLKDMTVRMIQRGERAILPPFEDFELQMGDLVIVAATRQSLSDLLASKPGMLQQIWRGDGNSEAVDTDVPPLSLVEAVVAPGSRMAGRTVELIGFRRLTSAVVLGIQRRSRMIRAKLGEIRLEAGDTLLLCGPDDAFQSLRASRDVILLEWSQKEIPITARGHAARLIAIAMVLAAALGVTSILIASVLAAVAMILLRCLNTRQAGRALDLKIYLVIAAALAMGTALEQTGAASLIANLVVSAAAPYGQLAVLSAIFLAVAILTNILSNAATAVLFAPVALEAAHASNADPLPYILAIIYAANCSFASPIAYQTNMLVMAPGHYRFSDFIKFGGPLLLVIWAAFTVLAPWRFDL
ncbi:SLC13 family permease [Henriciella aquimarina]|uniref:SLC13 family permease n=1 Tax=Henriciella aquimarina TaxID=545261 RepID=UPI0009FF390E|nr:SLC13 family permease [Henriciella aquimarina]